MIVFDGPTNNTSSHRPIPVELEHVELMEPLAWEVDSEYRTIQFDALE